jgi:uncharacterized protein
MPLIKQSVHNDMKTAMRERDKPRLSIIRLILAAFKQKEVDERIELDDPQALALLDKMVKQRRESIRQYQAAGRKELAEQEAFEIDIIQHYLPQQLSSTEIETLIKEAIAETGATSMKDMGKLMGLLKPKLQGRADIAAVSATIKALLN